MHDEKTHTSRPKYTAGYRAQIGMTEIILKAMEHRGMSAESLARIMKVDPAHITNILDIDCRTSLFDYAMVLDALDAEVEVTVTPR